MSVSVVYNGRFGNNLFQYTCARLFASDNGLRLLTPLVENQMVSALPYEGGKVVDGAALVLGDSHPLFSEKYDPAKYELRGFFQVGDWYFPREAEIKRFLKVPPIYEKNMSDIVLHCRLTDYRRDTWVIHPQWYLSILEKEKFGRLYIVTDEFDREFLAPFKPYDPEILSSSPEVDWAFLRSFDRMLISMSTFAWWAAFFSGASRIYTFKRYQFGVNLNKFRNAVIVDGPLLHEMRG